MGNSAKPVRHPLKKRDLSYMKPKGYKHYMTLTEVARAVGRDSSWLRKLEKRDKIPKSKRVSVGQLSVRLWSPKQVEEIRQITNSFKRGRPSDG